MEEACQYGADNYLLNLFKDECEKRSDPGDDLQWEHAARPKPHRANESTESEDLALFGRRLAAFAGPAKRISVETERP